ncbi:MAG: DNA polymerase I, partial [Bacteroidales bacterium]|nr:DNA polymerase I [Bacteroidales bacterium]
EDQLKLTAPNEAALKELFEELEFRTFAKRFFTYYSLQQEEPEPESQPLEQEGQGNLFGETEEEKTIQDISTTKHNYLLVDSAEKSQNLVDLLKKQKSFCFDTETTGLDPNNAELVGMSFSFKAHEAYYIPIPVSYHEAVKTVAPFKEVFENEGIKKIGQNIKYDIAILKWYDVEVKGTLFDTMIAHYLLEPDQRHNMDYLSETYLNYSPVSIETLIGKKGKKQLSMRDAPVEMVKEYAAEDADVTWQLSLILEPLLKETGTDILFRDTEMPLVPVLASMEAEGVKLDIDALAQYSEDLGKDIAELEKEIYSQAGEEFNINSPKQLGDILFDKLNIASKPKKTKTGQYSTGEDILVKLSYRHPIVASILDYRSLTKLKSTYVDSLPQLVNQRDGRVHTSYNQAVAATGRLSSNNPNLQNIPIRTERGREIRKAFIPRNEEFTLLAADYSQIELRIIAHLSKDEAMIAAFKGGLDIHTATAARVYGISPDEVTGEMRRHAKTVNFGIIYGISAFGLSERLGIPRREAADIIDSYFEKYPGIRQYMDQSIQFARDHGYVETILGRRRYLKDITSANAVVRGYAERNAINAPIQGSSADMIKKAMIAIYNEMQKEDLKSKMILQVHDELVFDVHHSELDQLKKMVEKFMVSALPLDVPVIVDMNTGSNWLEAH